MLTTLAVVLVLALPTIQPAQGGGETIVNTVLIPNGNGPREPPTPTVPAAQTLTTSASKAMISCSAEHAKRRLLVAVVTSPSHEKAREAIRQTWGNVPPHLSDRIDVRFFIGQLPPTYDNRDQKEMSLNNEANVVRLTSFTENYHNLTSKAIGIFSYGYEKCYSGVMKVDDDSYVVIERLLPYLDQFDWNNLYAGGFNKGIPVEKNPQGRWYAYDQYPHDVWPDYANGPGYFLGLNALSFIAMNQESLPKIRVDDCAVGVWTESLGLNKQDMPHSTFDYWIKEGSVWINPINYSEVYRLYAGQHITLHVCEKEQETACLCEGSPYFSHEQFLSCWGEESRKGYTDKIPRHMNA